MKKQTLNIQVKRIHRFNNDKPLKGYADIVVNDVLMIKGVRIIEGREGVFVAMPQSQAKDQKWYDTVYPVTKEARFSLQDQVIEEFNRS